MLCSLFSPALPGADGSPQPESASLNGLWSVNLSGDFAWLSNADLSSFYPNGTGTQGTSERQMFSGFALSMRRYISERFYAGLGLASLPKGYSFDAFDPDPVTGRGWANETYQWDALYPSLQGGWVLYRGFSTGLYLQAEAGTLFLTQATFERAGGLLNKGTFEGSTLAEALSAIISVNLMPSVALELLGGYRWARLPLTFTDKRGRRTPPVAPEYYIDYGGPYLRAGLSFLWGLRNPWGEQEEAPSAPRNGPPL